MIKIILKSILALTVIVLLLSGFFIYRYGGDLLLEYLMDSMGFHISYEGHCSGLEAFIFRTATLRNVTIGIPGTPVTIKCNKAHIGFDYSEIRGKSAVGLSVTLLKPELEIKDAFKSTEKSSFAGYLPPAFFSFTQDIEHIDVDNIYCNVFLWGDTADIRDLRLLCKEAIIGVRGLVTEEGSADIVINAYFSDIFLAGLPENVNNFLEDRSKGWKGLTIKIKNDIDPPVFVLDSGTIKLTLGGDI